MPDCTLTGTKEIRTSGSRKQTKCSETCRLLGWLRDEDLIASGLRRLVPGGPEVEGGAHVLQTGLTSLGAVNTAPKASQLGVQGPCRRGQPWREFLVLIAQPIWPSGSTIMIENAGSLCLQVILTKSVFHNHLCERKAIFDLQKCVGVGGEEGTNPYTEMPSIRAQ